MRFCSKSELRLCKLAVVQFCFFLSGFCHGEPNIKQDDQALKADRRGIFSAVCQLCPTLCDPVD